MPVFSALSWKYVGGDFKSLTVSAKMSKDTKYTVITLKDCKIIKNPEGEFYIQGKSGTGRDQKTLMMFWKNRWLPRIPTERDWIFATPADDYMHNTIHGDSARAIEVRSRDPTRDPAYVLTEADVMNKQHYC